MLFSGCGKADELRYEECVFSREEYYDEWIVESYDGITAKVIEATPERLAVELHNDLEFDIEFVCWYRACVNKGGVWYNVLPPKDVATTSSDEQKTEEDTESRTIRPGESKEFVYDFPAAYQGVTFPSGNYRISIGVQFLSESDPQRIAHEKVWVDFAIEAS